MPIERREGNYQEAGYDTQSFFNSSIHGDCTHADARFFRKIVDGRIAGFYAIQSTVDLDLSHDIQGVDDFRNATVVYELFRFERRQSDAQWQYPRFRKVAEKRIVVQECDQAEIGHDIVELIRDY